MVDLAVAAVAEADQDLEEETLTDMEVAMIRLVVLREQRRGMVVVLITGEQPWMT